MCLEKELGFMVCAILQGPSVQPVGTDSLVIHRSSTSPRFPSRPAKRDSDLAPARRLSCLGTCDDLAHHSSRGWTCSQLCVCSFADGVVLAQGMLLLLL
ncbi:hypothetical protein HPB50_013620 [Hyalomma asiaticum]|uniref:Uncharacterized protein n=1 Tax=Hyalomma asiaticum TaxID=266040 RepID=A0ACB7RNG9_HYAAI|nr:hypothetical protein HPB50_013620 [Hyalomma asiaticum]